jgi:hypothetical protein
MTIKDILRHQRMLIRETHALAMLNLKNSAANRAWLRDQLDHNLALIPREARLYQAALVRRLRSELDTIARLTPPRS